MTQALIDKSRFNDLGLRNALECTHGEWIRKKYIFFNTTNVFFFISVVTAACVFIFKTSSPECVLLSIVQGSWVTQGCLSESQNNFDYDWIEIYCITSITFQSLCFDVINKFSLLIWLRINVNIPVLLIYISTSTATFIVLGWLDWLMRNLHHII